MGGVYRDRSWTCEAERRARAEEDAVRRAVAPPWFTPRTWDALHRGLVAVQYVCWVAFAILVALYLFASSVAWAAAPLVGR
jgi:hypothetical protein